jgi:hypothetical protein
MRDPFEMRDDECWECIILELRNSGEPDLADELQDAVDSPLRQQELAAVAMRHPDADRKLEPVVQTCRTAGKCRV